MLHQVHTRLVLLVGHPDLSSTGYTFKVYLRPPDGRMYLFRVLKCACTLHMLHQLSA